jgi:hypothetical protein
VGQSTEPGFLRCAGTIASGQIAPGDKITVAASGKTSGIDQIVTYDGAVARAEAGDAFTITLADVIDVGRDEFSPRHRSRGSGSIHRPSHLNGSGGALSKAIVLHSTLHPRRVGHNHQPQIQDRRQYARSFRCQVIRAERDRLLQHLNLLPAVLDP